MPGPAHESRGRPACNQHGLQFMCPVWTGLDCCVEEDATTMLHACPWPGPNLGSMHVGQIAEPPLSFFTCSDLPQLQTSCCAYGVLELQVEACVIQSVSTVWELALVPFFNNEHIFNQTPNPTPSTLSAAACSKPTRRTSCHYRQSTARLQRQRVNFRSRQPKL